MLDHSARDHLNVKLAQVRALLRGRRVGNLTAEDFGGRAALLGVLRRLVRLKWRG